jgi:hypothetical protein
MLLTSVSLVFAGVMAFSDGFAQSFLTGCLLHDDFETLTPLGDFISGILGLIVEQSFGDSF